MVWEAVNLDGQEGGFWSSLMARRRDLLGSAGQEHSVTAGVQPFCPPGSWGLPGTFHYRGCLISFFKLRLIFCLFHKAFARKELISHPCGYFVFPTPGLGRASEEPWGAGPSQGGKARADLQQFTEFLVLMTACDSLEPQLGDSVTSATWLPLW